MNRFQHHWVNLGILLVFLLAGTWVSLLWAPSAQAVLPPRPTVGAPVSDGDATPTPVPTVAKIHLRVTPGEQAYWSVVQWQDAQGNWHDVRGWQGDVAHGEISWWVDEKDFGKGPFRWVVYPPGGRIVDQGEGRFIYRGKQHILAVSDSFYLPASSSASLGIFVSAPVHKR